MLTWTGEICQDHFAFLLGAVCFLELNRILGISFY